MSRTVIREAYRSLAAMRVIELSVGRRATMVELDYAACSPLIEHGVHTEQISVQQIHDVRLTERPNLLWVQVETDEGITGLGDAFFLSATVETYLHKHVAPASSAGTPQIDLLSADLNGYPGFRSSGVEVRGNSAFDIALWDIFGKMTGQPIAQLLGGFSRRVNRTCNTCAGVEYSQRDPAS